MASHHKWGAKSLNKLETAHPNLNSLFTRVLETCPLDITIIETYRSNDRQDELFELGKSKLRAGQSKHNTNPSKAIDVAPLVNGTIDWNDRELWIMFAGYVLGVASEMNIPLRWGGDWDNDFNSREHSFWDAPHFELTD
jgi:hypothetical protein